MIPPRGQINKITGQDDAPSQSAATELVVKRKKTKQRPTKADSNLRDAADFARSTAQDQAVKAFSEAIEGTPLGLLSLHTVISCHKRIYIYEKYHSIEFLFLYILFFFITMYGESLNLDNFFLLLLGIVMDFMKFVEGSMTENDAAFDAGY